MVIHHYYMLEYFFTNYHEACNSEMSKDPDLSPSKKQNAKSYYVLCLVHE